MSGYDNWKLASPYDPEPDYETMASYYDVSVDALTDSQVARYEENRAYDKADFDYDRSR